VTLRPFQAACILACLAALAMLALSTPSAAQDNNTPETAAPLDQHNYVTEYLNASDDNLQYWYWMDIQRGEELFVYFYGTGEPYHRCRMLYYVHGPDSYESSDVVHAEYWYQQKQSRNDYSDIWHWICPNGGRYYFHFYAVGTAVGDFHANISLDRPKELFRTGTDSGTLWWGGVTDLNKNDVWRIWLVAGPTQVEGTRVTVTWTYDHAIHLYAYDLVDRFEQNMLNLSYAHPGDRKEVIRFTASYTGWYYIRVEYGSWSGTEDYTINTADYSAPNDGDNTPANATHVLKSGSVDGRIEASRDMHDWFSVDLVKGDVLGISMQLMDPNNPNYNPGAPNLFNFYEIQVYDPFMRRVPHGYDANQGWPVPDTFINNLPIQPGDISVDGTYFIRASFYTSYGYYYDVANTSGHVIAFADYVIQLTFPNRAPRINESALEEVIMLEDTTWWENLAGQNVSSLDLDTVFLDPELGVMSYTVRGDANVTAKRVSDHLLTLKPAKDWFGEADVALTAMDDSGNSASATLHVIVVPVNDAPRLIGPGPVTFLEDDPSEGNRTVDLYDWFFDVDPTDSGNLTFSEAGATPSLSVAFDQANGTATISTPADVNGDFFIGFKATDPGGLSAQIEIKVTVTPVNDAPRALGEAPSLVYDEGFMLATFDAAEHLYDPDGDTDLVWTLGYADAGDGANLSVTNEGKSVWNSEIVITPANNRHDWFGQVVVVITCTDPGGLSGQQWFTITIRNTPDPPVIAAWTPRTDASFPEGGSLTFSVDSVKDPDGEQAVLYFSYRMKGPDDLKWTEVQNGTDSSWTMTAGYEDEGEYRVSVVVLDEDLMTSASPLDWVVTVTKTNRPPTLSISSPSNGSSVEQGKWVEFVAAVDDPDVEDRSGLSVEWYEGDTWLGQGRTFSLRNLKPGTHEITAVVADPGDLEGEATVSIKVTKKDEGPGFAGLSALLALASLAVLSTGFSRGRSSRR